MTDLSDSYSPQWLYLDEFARALRPDVELTDDYSTFEPTPDTEEAAEVKAAIALLVRDRIIANGKLNEAEFRFLEGKPDLTTTAWVNQLAADDFNWRQSHLIAGVDTTKPKGRLHDHIGLLIEIAASALQYFGKQADTARRTPPEQTRTAGLIEKLFSEGIPPELGPADILKRLNDHIGTKGRLISKDTLRRVLDKRK
ncbi:hypothetical protein ACVWZR_007769 [Bradyrhizobium sp. i1.3.1]